MAVPGGRCSGQGELTHESAAGGRRRATGSLPLEVRRGLRRLSVQLVATREDDVPLSLSFVCVVGEFNISQWEGVTGLQFEGSDTCQLDQLRQIGAGFLGEVHAELDGAGGQRLYCGH
jgi:hypothetical protein